MSERKTNLLETFEENGYRCDVIHNGMGYRCGYVTVPEGHPAHGVDYDDLYHLECHGGLTYAKPDEATTGWTLGFDCAHSWDAQDKSFEGIPYMPYNDGIVRTTAYVKKECSILADQLKAMETE